LTAWELELELDSDVDVEMEIEMEDGVVLEIQGYLYGDPITGQQQRHSWNGEEGLKVWALLVLLENAASRPT
jgi:hypothetical protein